MTTVDGIDVSFTPDQMEKAKHEERAAVADPNAALTQSARTADISSPPESPTRKLRERKPSGDARDNNTHHASKHHRRSSSSSSSGSRRHKRTSSTDRTKEKEQDKDKDKGVDTSRQPPLTDRNRMTDEEYEAALRQPKHLRSRSLAEKIDFERQFRAKKAEEERKAQTDNVFSRLRETSDLRSQKLAEMETERKAQIEAELQRQKQTILEQAEAERAKKKLRNAQRELQNLKPKTDSGDHSRKTSLELEEEEAERVAKGLTDPSPPTRSTRMSLGDRVAAQIMEDKRNGRSGTSISVSASPVDSARALDKTGGAAPAYFSKPSDELVNKQTINRQDSLRDFEKDRATTKELQNSIAEARLQLEEEEKFEKARRAKEKLDELEKQKKAEEEKRRLEEEEKRNEVLRKKQEAIKAFEEKRRWEKLTNEQKAAEEAEKARIAAEEAAKKKEEDDRLAEIARKKKAEEEAAAAAAAEAEVVSFKFHGAEESDDEGTDKKPDKNDVKTPQVATPAAETTTSTPASTQEKEKEKLAKEKAAKEFAAADAAANPEPAKVTGCKCLIM